jgi:hypothetical protein
MLYIEEGLEKVIGLLGSEFCIYGKYTKLYSINKQFYSYSNKKKKKQLYSCAIQCTDLLL